MKKHSEENHKKWAQLVAKAWQDPHFKAKLLSSPAQVLKEHGLAHNPKATYRVIEARSHEMCYILPAKPEGNLTAEELKNLAAASGTGACGGCGGCY